MDKIKQAGGYNKNAKGERQWVYRLMNMSKTKITFRVPKTPTPKYLATVPEAKIFRSHDGKIIKNLDELAQVLRNMSDDTYIYHVNRSKNDFATWVRVVLGDRELAADLKTTMSRSDAANKVRDRVYYLSSIK